MMMNDTSVGKGCFSQWQHTPFHCDASDDILVEASPYDGIWGIKMAETDENAHNPLKWRGQNLLGFALVEVRDALREVCKNEHLAPQSQT